MELDDSFVLQSGEAQPAGTDSHDSPGSGLAAASEAVAAMALLAACGGGSSGTEIPAPVVAAPSPPPPTLASTPASARDAARFLSQASFGPRSADEVEALQRGGFEAWMAQQFALPAASHLGYVEQQRQLDKNNSAAEELSYEAVWQQWLFGDVPLRSRASWALLQIFVVSNIAPDIRTHAMSSYMDMLNRNAFGNYRQLLEDVTLHPAMGYYLNLVESEKEDLARGTHPNENYAREVLQLFSIGLNQLNPDGTVKVDAAGKAIPTFDEAVIKGYAKAFSGWSFGSLDNRNANAFHDHDENIEALWQTPMQPWSSYHDSGAKTLLNGRVLPAGQSAQQDMQDALDSIFNHPNVGPFIGRQLIQRLVTSNPSAAHVQRVSAAFANNGAGVRGDLRAVLRAVLLDLEVRGDAPATRSGFGKQREPVLRFAQLLRALNAKSATGRNPIHYLDGADDALGQSPLLAPSVFNFYSPFYRPAGPLANAGLAAPEFQITSETTVVGSLNFFASVIHSGGYGWDNSRLVLDYAPLMLLAGDAAALTDRLDLLLFDLQMGAATRSRLATLLKALPGASTHEREQRVKSALLVALMSPDHVIQK